MSEGVHELVEQQKVAPLKHLVGDISTGLVEQRSAKENIKRPPPVVYHGSPNVFNTFDPNRSEGRGSDMFGPGVYFTEDPEVADVYARNLRGRTGAPNITPVRLNLVKTFDIDAKPDPKIIAALKKDTERGPHSLLRGLKKLGLKSVGDLTANEYYTNEYLYDILTTWKGDKAEVNQWLRSKGFDSITNLSGYGAIYSPHQIWIVLANRSGGYEKKIESIFSPPSAPVQYWRDKRFEIGE